MCTGTEAGAHVGVFLRGFAIVCLTASNVAQIAGQHWIGAFVNGCAISWVWWANAHQAAHSQATYGRLAYAIGAGLGTITGMWAVTWIYR